MRSHNKVFGYKTKYKNSYAQITKLPGKGRSASKAADGLEASPSSIMTRPPASPSCLQRFANSAGSLSVTGAAVAPTFPYRFRIPHILENARKSQEGRRRMSSTLWMSMQGRRIGSGEGGCCSFGGGQIRVSPSAQLPCGDQRWWRNGDVARGAAIRLGGDGAFMRGVCDSLSVQLRSDRSRPK